jgi:AcrR family transcriptional regulator
VPRQDRSEKLVDAILTAAVRVLERDGAARFTTARVAERAGVSVGSLYQYFADKEAILVRLQEREWSETAALLEGIFADTKTPAAARLREAVRAFFRTEVDEAPLRRALGSAMPPFHETAHAKRQRERGLPLLMALIDDVKPGLSPKKRAFAAELYVAQLAAMGEHVSETNKSRAEVDAWADAVSDMYLAWLKRR